MPAPIPAGAAPDAPDNLVLAGMMGTGKTTVGREIARRLARPLVDLDETIEASAGTSIGALFAKDGEPAFRAREREAVRGLATVRGTVIATGGWTVADPESRRLLESIGTIVCLTGEPAVLAARLSAADVAGRPALGGAADVDAVRALLERRRPVYDSLPWQVDTTARDAPTVADHVLALARIARAIEGETAEG